jgi:hypothetical protein
VTLFRLLLRGKNFPLQVDGKEQLMGFHATRLVEAEDRIEAATKALALLKGEPELVAVPAGCGATITYEEIVEAERGEASEAGGFAFFPMG